MMFLRMNRTLYMAALRVLGDFGQGRECSPLDLSILRRHARPQELDLSVDLLCCAVINRELVKPGRRRRPTPSSA